MKVRAIELLRAGWGAVLLAIPGLVLASVRGVQVDRKAIVVVRILGARHLVQALSSGVNPSPEVLAAGVWVDTVHSLTALARRPPTGTGFREAWPTASSRRCGREWVGATCTAATSRQELFARVIGWPAW